MGKPRLCADGDYLLQPSHDRTRAGSATYTLPDSHLVTCFGGDTAFGKMLKDTSGTELHLFAVTSVDRSAPRLWPVPPVTTIPFSIEND